MGAGSSTIRDASCIIWVYPPKIQAGKPIKEEILKGKKFFVLFAAIFFIVGCGKDSGRKEIADADCSGYEVVDFVSIPMEDGVEAFIVREDGTILCSGGDEKLYVCEGTGENPQEIPSSSFYGNLCAEDGVFYAYDYKNLAVVQLGEDSGLPEIHTRGIQSLVAFHTIRNMVASDGKIYVLAIPLTEENTEDFYSFGIERFEDYGEQVYCIDVASGESHTLGLAHITAEYCSEDGRLFFYGWQEEQYYLYEYDTKKEKIAQKLSFDSMGNLLNIVVEGGYLFGFDPSEGLLGIDLKNGEKTVWSSDVYAMFGNDLQFYRGNLFVNDIAAKEIRQVLVVDTQGEIRERQDVLDPAVADGTIGDAKEDKDSGSTVELLEHTPSVTEWPKRTETVTVASAAYLPFSAREIKRICGMRTKEVELPVDLEAIVTELMAGNPDVDIYVFPLVWPLTQRIKELGLYAPLNDSGIISDHIGKCFDYVTAAATNGNGDIWMLPMYEYAQVTWYIPENMEKLGVTPEELGTVDGYLAVLERLHGETGKYRYYNQASVFWNQCDALYDMVYNDYESGQVNFDTERYRSLAEFFWTGWDRYSGLQANHPWFFNAEQQQTGEHRAGKTPDFDRNSVIFKTDHVSSHLYKELFSVPEQSRIFLEGWRAIPFPSLETGQETGLASIHYAYVNPYSKQKNAAVEYLEVIAANQNRIVGLPVFFREDVEYYEELYDTSMPAFQDIYGIYKNSAVKYGYSWDLSMEYITDYQRGLITLDEAIERRQKIAVTGLYE